MYRISSIPKLNNSARVGRKYLLFRKTPFYPSFLEVLLTHLFQILQSLQSSVLLLEAIKEHPSHRLEPPFASFSMIPVTQS